eukprot:TRINITY_DN10102_c0_g1_i1.p1 TRINITY_DN10102_c0_g1~~TRINITY_DN10102_c0_g1_i1.p1  ORF type:complete len:261 (+),score=54.54 TRINITY_DN10102_c0_g1_i1:456-1238(+)
MCSWRSGCHTRAADEMGDNDVVVPMGKLHLKGVGESVRACLLLPRSLEGREAYIRQQDETQASLQSFLSLDPERRNNLQTVSASMAIVNMKFCYSMGAVMLHVDEILRKILMVCDRTHGVVVSVHGSNVAVVWNTSKKNVNHVKSSMQFVDMMGGNMKSLGQSSELLGIGLSNNQAIHGTVGTGRQKFITVLGPCFDISSKLCMLAVESNTFCLYCTQSEQPACTDDGVAYLFASNVALPGGVEADIFAFPSVSGDSTGF